MIVFEWRGELVDEEMVDLVWSYGGNVRLAGGHDCPHSFGWVTAREEDGLLVGFVNVVSDGRDHAFLIDTKTGQDAQRWKGTRPSSVAARRVGRHEWAAC